MSDTTGTPARTGLFAQLSSLLRGTPKRDDKVETLEVALESDNKTTRPVEVGYKSVSDEKPTHQIEALARKVGTDNKEVFNGRPIHLMTLSELQRRLDSLGLSSAGSKDDLVLRLTLAQKKLREVEMMPELQAAKQVQAMPQSLEDKRDALAAAVKAKWPVGMSHQDYQSLASQLAIAKVNGQERPERIKISPQTPKVNAASPKYDGPSQSSIEQMTPTFANVGSSTRKRQHPGFYTANHVAYKRRSLGGGNIPYGLHSARKTPSRGADGFTRQPSTLLSNTASRSRVGASSRYRVGLTPRRHSIHSSLLMDNVYGSPQGARTPSAHENSSSRSNVNRDDIAKRILDTMKKMATPLDEVRNRRLPSWVTPRSKLPRYSPTELPPSATLSMPPKVIQVDNASTMPRPVSVRSSPYSKAEPKKQLPVQKAKVQNIVTSSSETSNKEDDKFATTAQVSAPLQFSSETQVETSSFLPECSFGFSPPVGEDIDHRVIAAQITDADMAKFQFTSSVDHNSRPAGSNVSLKLSMKSGSLSSYETTQKQKSRESNSEPIPVASKPTQLPFSMTRTKAPVAENAQKEPKEKANAGSATPVAVGNTDWMKKFLPKEGEWKCHSCSVLNKPNDTQCVSCEEPKKAEESKPKSSPAPTPQVQDWAKKFLPKPGEWKCLACSVVNKPDATQCISCETEKEQGNDSAPNHSKVETTAKSPEKESSEFKFGAVEAGKAPAFVFGGSSAEGSTAPEAAKSKTPLFGASTSKVAEEPKPLFGASSTSKDDAPKPLFGASSTSKDDAPKPLFGASATSKDDAPKPLFGASATSKDDAPKPLFGASSTSKDDTPKPLFGASSTSKDDAPKPLFGASATSKDDAPKPLFGASSTSTDDAPKSLFGASSTSKDDTPKPLFGTSATSKDDAPKPLFGTSATSKDDAPKPLFGAGSTGKEDTAKPLFGASSSTSKEDASKPLFGSASDSASKPTSTMFGASSKESDSTKPLFGGAATGNTTSTDLVPSTEKGGSNSLFGGSSSSSMFGTGTSTSSTAPAPSKPLFGSSTTGEAEGTKSIASENKGSSGIFQFGATTTSSGERESNPAPAKRGRQSESDSSTSMFSNSNSGASSSAGTFVFGAGSSSQPPKDSSSNSLFGNAPAASGTFGAPNPASAAPTTQFGTPAASTPFGGGSTSATTTPGFMFGAGDSKPATGTSGTPGTFQFGSTGSSTPAQSSGMFGTTQPAAAQSTSFGSKTPASTFGTPANSSANTFGNSNTGSTNFGAPASGTPFTGNEPSSTAFGASGGMQQSSGNMFGAPNPSPASNMFGNNMGMNNNNFNNNNGGFGSANQPQNGFGAPSTTGFGNTGAGNSFGGNTFGGVPAAAVPMPESQGAFSMGAGTSNPGQGGAKPRRKYRARRRK